MQAKINHWDEKFADELMNILDRAERPPEDIIQFSNLSTATHGEYAGSNMSHLD
jgi:hypothetical protein